MGLEALTRIDQRRRIRGERAQCSFKVVFSEEGDIGGCGVRMMGFWALGGAGYRLC